MSNLKKLNDLLKKLQQSKKKEYNPFEIANKFLRNSQQIPFEKWNIWLLMTGRGFGKTLTGSATILQYILSKKYKNICIISKTIDDAKKVMIEGESGILKIAQKFQNYILEFYNFTEDLSKSDSNNYILQNQLQYEYNFNLTSDSPTPNYIKSQNKLTWENGSELHIYSAENLEKLRGPQFDLIWADEFAKFDNQKDIFDQLLLCLRLGNEPKMIITTTPRSTKFMKELVTRKDIYITHGNTYENKENLSENYINSIKLQFEGTKFGEQEINGKIVDKNYVFWNENNIYECKLDQNIQIKIDEFIKNNEIDQIINNLNIKRIVLAIDPAVTATGDETGIIISGTDGENFYILDDKSGKHQSNEWCKIAIEAYYKWNATRIVVETNNGGDLIEKLMRSYDKNISYKGVYATKSKIFRMEPIFALYQQKRVKHISKFFQLEHQMLNIEEYNSPDRIDALVWSIDELMNNSSNKIKVSMI